MSYRYTRKYLSFYSIFFLLWITGCHTYKKAYYHPDHKHQTVQKLPEKELIETLYLIGDAGDEDILDTEKNALFPHLLKALNEAPEHSSVVFLGDNVYPAGLPKKDHKDREIAEIILGEQLKLVENFQGKTYFIPGNHDWNHMKGGGLKAIERQEDFVQKFYDDIDVKFYPNDGCGDPKVKKITKDLYYIFIDSQWWLQNWEHEKNMNKGCAVKSRQEFLQVLEEIFLTHKNDQLVVFMHHPLFSNGEHSGKFSLQTHVFPLTDMKKYLWIPLPVLGSVMPLYRSLGGSRQDIPNPLYQEFKNEILSMIELNKHVIFASGHDHSLQYFADNGHHHIISGSGSKISYTRKGGNAIMAHSAIGYSKLYLYEDGEVWLEFIKVNKQHPNGHILFRKQIVSPKPGSQAITEAYPLGSQLPDSIVYEAKIEFDATKFKRLLMGSQYRDVWTTPVKAPIINFDTEKGGLTPIKKGGGMASNSLRVEAQNGDQYALRSIAKDYTKLFGPDLANLKAIHIMEDMNSASHPYAPLVLPKLSKAANIYYTIPKLVYLKKQNGLGTYNNLFQEEFYLLEDRPAGNRSHSDHLGNSEEIISYLDLLERKLEDNSIQIDQSWTLRSRLFDIWIHDWDRHDDQWRWAKIDSTEEVYRPIPRDRDQAFYKFEGMLPWMVANFGIRKFKTFKHNVKDVKYQSFNARYFDRYFLHELEWSDWEKEIRFLQTNLTDDIIQEAMKELPPEVYDISYKDIQEKLIARRENLYSMARKLYNYLSVYVSIPGSNEDEYFQVTRHEDGNVTVRVFNLTKEGTRTNQIYERTFIQGETNEIRLYGLGGKDQFVVEGDTKSSIQVRIVGGFGKDEVYDSSNVGGLQKMTKVYDEEDGIEIESAGEVKDLTGPGIDKNDYEREDHLYNKHAVMPSLGFTPDDRFWIGFGLTSTIHGFRKQPYKSKHILKANFSPSSRTAFHFIYNGDFSNALFNVMDINPIVQLDNPLYINYYGLGNNSTKSNNTASFHWVRLRQYQTSLLFKKGWVNNRFNVYAGPSFSSWSVKNVEGRILDDPEFSVDDEMLKAKNYLGIITGVSIDNRDNILFPKSGFATTVEGSILSHLANDGYIYSAKAEQSFYITFGSRFATTLASRTGWAMAKGDVQIYHYPSIGNNHFLRGFRNDRYRGNHIFYQNVDLRLLLVHWKNSILPMEIGLLGGYDVGRVWLDGEQARLFHHGYTAGLWFNLLSVIVLQPHVSFSKEERLFNFKMGFNF